MRSSPAGIRIRSRRGTAEPKGSESSPFQRPRRDAHPQHVRIGEPPGPHPLPLGKACGGDEEEDGAVHARRDFEDGGRE